MSIELTQIQQRALIALEPKESHKTTGELAALIGANPRTLLRHLWGLQEMGLIDRWSQRSWCLPDPDWRAT